MQITTPWTDDQVKSINEFQELAPMHPFTCICSRVLYATSEGMKCHECEYTQNWVHQVMIDWTWKKYAQDTLKFFNKE